MENKDSEKHLAQWPALQGKDADQPTWRLLPHLSRGKVIPAATDARELLRLFRRLLVQKVELPQGQPQHCLEQLPKVADLEPQTVWESLLVEYIHVRLGLLPEGGDAKGWACGFPPLGRSTG